MKPLKRLWPVSQRVLLPERVCGGLNTGGPKVGAKANGRQVSEIGKELVFIDG